MWLVLLTMVGMACLPLVHNHVHHHPVSSIDARTGQMASQDAALQDSADSHANHSHSLPDSQADDCAVCAHHDRSCHAVFAALVPMPVQARAPPPPASLGTFHSPPAAWALFAPRAPPALPTSSSPRLA